MANIKSLLERHTQKHYKTSSRMVRRGMPWPFFKRKSGIFRRFSGLLRLWRWFEIVPYLIGEDANAQAENEKWREKTIQTYLKR